MKKIFIFRKRAVVDTNSTRKRDVKVMKNIDEVVNVFMIQDEEFHKTQINSTRASIFNFITMQSFENTDNNGRKLSELIFSEESGFPPIIKVRVRRVFIIFRKIEHVCQAGKNFKMFEAFLFLFNATDIIEKFGVVIEKVSDESAQVRSKTRVKHFTERSIFGDLMTLKEGRDL